MNQLYRKWCRQVFTLLAVALGGLGNDQVIAQCNSVNTLTVPSAYTTSALVGNGNFNAIVFGNVTSSGGDVEGRLAVGGNFTFNPATVGDGYSVGLAGPGTGRPDAPAQTDNFIVNGTFNNQSGIEWRVRGNFIYTTNAAGSTLPSHAASEGTNSQTPAGSRLDFLGLKTYYTNLSANLAALTPVGSYSVNGNDITLIGNGTAQNYVFTIDFDRPLNNPPAQLISGINFENIPATGSTVLINIRKSGTVVFAPGSMSPSYQTITLFNFPNETSVTVANFALEGSFLAPRANLNGSNGSINGQTVIGGNFSQTNGFEFHNSCLNQLISPIVTLSGSVFNDLNGLTDNTVNGTPVSSLGGNTFYANLVNSTGTVVSSTSLTSGTYSFTGVTGNSSYSVVLSNTPGAVGTASPSTTLTGGVVNSGENVGSGTGSDGTPNGVISITVAMATISNVNFGVRLPPDLTPIIYARPGTVYGTTDITVVVDVVELLGVATNGLITVRVTKDALMSLTFDPNATSIGGRTVKNSNWTQVDLTNTAYYVFTTTTPVPAGDLLTFGMSGKITPGASTGTLTISTVIDGGSGGEIKITNNVDADKIDYFQQ